MWRHVLHMYISTRSLFHCGVYQYGLEVHVGFLLSEHLCSSSNPSMGWTPGPAASKGIVHSSECP